ncbi:MAG: hypothetical protein JSU94_06295 [Phycisphaerales bacterium]|nr:MAG: hypothetical protein JSU94_06295 [Phycisphaerales bacterium]
MAVLASRLSSCHPFWQTDDWHSLTGGIGDLHEHRSAAEEVPGPYDFSSNNPRLMACIFYARRQ